jgi:NDP-sugar pyrophosphorylase family protein
MGQDVVILCGGLGTRLKEVTGETPKVLAEVDGKPFLDIVLEFVLKQKPGRVILAAGYKAELLQAHYRDNFPDADIVISAEETPLGTAGAVKEAEVLIRSDVFFVFNGDCLCPVDLGDLYAFHVRKRARASIVVSKVDDSRDYGVVLMDEKKRVQTFHEKIESQWPKFVNAGVYCFNRDVLDLIPAGEKSSLEYDLFPKLTGDAFFGFETDKPFIDIGTPERYTWAQTHLKEWI